MTEVAPHMLKYKNNVKPPQKIDFKDI